jgi:hypothetical protein
MKDSDIAELLSRMKDDYIKRDIMSSVRNGTTLAAAAGNTLPLCEYYI